MRQNHLTSGPVFPTLLAFSLPFLLTNLLQALYGAVDLFMVGRYADSAGVAAVATASQVMQTLTSLIVGLTTGGTIVIAQHYGARQNRDAASAIASTCVVFLLVALLLTIALIAAHDAICHAMQVPPEALSATKQYLFCCACGIVFIVGFNVAVSILRGLGDSRTPFYFMIAACIINILLDWLFVGKLRLGAGGAACATVLAQGASLFFAVLALTARGAWRRYRRYQPQFQIFAAQRIISVGLPIALQEGLVNISFLLITAILNSLGLVAAAAVGVVEKLILFSMLPTTAFAAAVAAMTAQNSGAGLLQRARSCLKAGILLSLLFGFVCFSLAQTKGSFFIGLFSPDAAVIEAGLLYLRSYSLDCILVCFVFCLNTFFSGSGHPIFPLVHSLLSTFLLRVPLSYWLSQSGDLWAVGFAAPAATAFSLLLCLFYYQRLLSKKELPPF